MAAHPFIPGNYHRGTVWNEMGIDTSYFVSDFSELEYFGKRSYCTDSSAFQNFRKFYEQMPEDKPRFAYMLTIQNHGDWTFNDDVDNIVHIEDKHGLSDVDKERMDEYLSCIKLTDDFIDEIISYFSGNGRNVVVYMVGDHCPSLLNEPSFDHSDELNNSDLSLEEQKSSDLPKRKVPYFIWCSNLDNLSSMPDNSEIDLCALSAYAVKAAGLPLSYYFDQLLKVSAQSQCITSIDNISNGQTTIGFINGSGEEESINSDSDIAEEIRKYFCLEYNSLQNSLREDCFFTPYGF